jgi:hypothetical protein
VVLLTRSYAEGRRRLWCLVWPSRVGQFGDLHGKASLHRGYPAGDGDGEVATVAGDTSFQCCHPGRAVG